jgi:hypothetical protein
MYLFCIHIDFIIPVIKNKYEDSYLSLASLVGIDLGEGDERIKNPDFDCPSVVDYPMKSTKELHEKKCGLNTRGANRAPRAPRVRVEDKGEEDAEPRVPRDLARKATAVTEYFESD